MGSFGATLLSISIVVVPSFLKVRAAEATPFQPARTRAVAANPSPDIPEYAHPLEDLSKSVGWDAVKGVDWLDVGINSRLRYENRENDYSSPRLISDDAFYNQTLVYLGVREVIDPLRLAGEFQDARRALTDRPPSASEQDHTDALQAHADLYFKEAMGGQSLDLTAGRMTLDLVDRRLVSRTRFNNVINSFDGFRVRLGDERKPWEVNVIAVSPVERNVNEFDERLNNIWMYGVTGAWRSASPAFQFEPFWLYLDQNAERTAPLERTLNTFGFHAFGLWNARTWDYDVSLVGQIGETRGLPQRAWAAHAEVGYTWRVPWRPRVAVWLNYASGDHDPGDGVQQRFDPLFGATFAFYGYSGYFNWQNIVEPSIRFSAQPTEKLRTEIIYRGYALASAKDAWVRGLRIDPSGTSGSFIGQELDVRVAYPIWRFFEVEVVYAHFFPGEFVANTGPSPQSNFTYLQGTLRF